MNNDTQCALSAALTLPRPLVRLCCALAFALSLGVIASSSRAASAATLTVNSLGDTPDAAQGDGKCADASGACTLRAAIQEANALTGDDAINFSVTGTISLLGALPDMSNLKVVGPGASQLTVRRDGGAATRFRVFTAALFSTVSISGMTISGGHTSEEDGGGIYANQGTSLSLSDVVVRDNVTESTGSTAGKGGGVYFEGSSLTLTNSTVSGNAASNGAPGGVSSGRDGGGIYINRGTAIITNSTISGNKTGGAGGVGQGFAGSGGGLYVSSAATVTMTNSTVSGNKTGTGFGGAAGGGIYNSQGNVTVNSCTVSGNTGFSGGGMSSTGTRITLRNTIVAGNVASANTSPDVSGLLSSQDYNLIGNTSGADIGGTTTHNLTGVDPMLGPLQDNGGSTQTHPLLPGSPAIDAGSGGGLTTDQRGLTRPFDNPSVPNAVDGTDIGAYEAQPAAQLRFGASAFLANESDGRATITVTRTGDTSGTSTVDARTIDDARAIRCDDTATAPGVAFARCDYATTVTTLTFAPGETSKTFTVPIIDDSFVEPDESVTLSLSNPTGAALGAQGTAALVIHDNDTPGQPNPLNNTDFFVRMQYLDFLSREPEAGQPWSGVINGCPAGDTTCDRVSVSSNFFRSQEFQLKGLFVFKFYKAAFGRMPTYAEIVSDMAAVTGSTTAELIAKKAAFTSAFAQRAEFTTAFGAMSNQQFVDALLGRYGLPSVTTLNPASPDDTTAPRVALSRDDLVGRLAAGSLTRGQVVRAVADSDEVARAEFNPAFVAMQYFGYLRRDPEPAGYQAWLQTINANPSDFRSMVNGFMNSTEYRLRFGQP